MARWRGDRAGCFVGESALGQAAGARRGRGAVVIDSDDGVTMVLEGLILRDWDVFAGLQRRLFEFLLWNDRLAQEEQATSAVLQAVMSRQVRSASRLRILMPYALLLKHLIQFLDALLLLLHLVERLRRQPPEFANHLLELGVRRLVAALVDVEDPVDCCLLLAHEERDVTKIEALLLLFVVVDGNGCRAGLPADEGCSRLGRAEVVEGARSGPRVQIRQAAAIDIFLIQSEQLAGPRIRFHQIADLHWMPKAHVLLVNFPLEQVCQVKRGEPFLGLFLLLFVKTRLLILLL